MIRKGLHWNISCVNGLQRILRIFGLKRTHDGKMRGINIRSFITSIYVFVFHPINLGSRVDRWIDKKDVFRVLLFHRIPCLFIPQS
jgi:hypothetical protein